MFRGFLIFYQVLLSPQEKRRGIIFYKDGICDLPYKIPNYLRYSISGNEEITGKCLSFIE